MSVITILSLSIFLMLTNVYAKTYIIKDCKKNKANVMYNFVKANYEYQDVTWHIDWLNQCDQSKPKLLNEKDADEFRQISLDAEANYLFEKAEALSYYHDSNKELNDYTEFTKMHNLKFNQVKNENAQGEYYLTDLVKYAADEMSIATVAISPEEALGVNTIEQLKEIESIVKKAE